MSVMETCTNDSRRKILTSAVCCLLSELGVESSDQETLETMTEIAQSFITELGNSSRSYCELAGRTEPLIGDVIVALVNMGISIDNIESHARRPNRTILPAPSQATHTKQLNILMLQAGVRKVHPAHIPIHLPYFPDPHAYIRTPTHKQPVTEYEAIREKAASQKRDVERALTRFVAKTSETHSLFHNEDNNIFPLIACKPQHPPYLKALLFSDQVFDVEEEFSTTPQRVRKVRENEGDEEDGEENREGEDGGKGESEIDNPYLRPVKLPRKKKAHKA